MHGFHLRIGFAPYNLGRNNLVLAFYTNKTAFAESLLTSLSCQENGKLKLVSKYRFRWVR